MVEAMSALILSRQGNKLEPHPVNHTGMGPDARKYEVETDDFHLLVHEWNDTRQFHFGKPEPNQAIILLLAGEDRPDQHGYFTFTDWRLLAAGKGLKPLMTEMERKQFRLSLERRAFDIQPIAVIKAELATGFSPIALSVVEVSFFLR